MTRNEMLVRLAALFLCGVAIGLALALLVL
jgi:hypothetical protein